MNRWLITGWLLLGALRTGAETQAPANNPPPEAVARREYLIGLSLLRENNFASAAEAFQRATAARTNFAEAYHQWGITLLRMGQLAGTPQLQAQRLQDAAAKFARASELQPANPVTWLSWSETLSLIGDLPVEPELRLACYQAAVEKARKAVELAPEHWQAYSQWAGILTGKLPEFAANEPARVQLHLEAASLYSNAMERATFKGDIASACANWGAALVRAARATSDLERKQRLLQEAIEKFQQSAQTAPNAALTHTMCGSALVQLGKLTGARNDFRQAITYFNTSLALKPGDAATLYALACVHALMGNPILAIESLKNCFAVDPAGEYRRLALQDPDLAGIRDAIGFKDLYRSDGSPGGLGVGNPPLRDAPR